MGIKVPIRRPDQATFTERLDALKEDTSKNLKRALTLLNERHVAIRVGAQHAVCDTTTPTHAVLPQKESEFKKRYRPIVYELKGRSRSLGAIWLDWPGRKAYDGTLVFKPTGADAVSPDDFNTWRGFRLTPKQGDWGLFRRHLKDVVCRGNTEFSEYLLNYFAHMVQHPGRLPGVALVLRGKQGTGKTIVYKMLELLFHTFNTVLAEDPKRIAGNFNSHLAEKVLVCADEALFARDKQLVGKLKSTITAERMLFEAKGFDAVPLDNYVRLIIISNDEHVVHAAADERRYFVLETAETFAQRPGESESAAAARRKAHFDPISKQMKKDGGAAAMMYDLMRRPLRSFDPKVIPESPFLSRQKELSREPHEQWWADVLDGGRSWFSKPHVEKRHVMEHHRQWMRDHHQRFVKSDAEIGRYLCELYGASISHKVRLVAAGHRVPVYSFPDLATAKQRFAQRG